MAGRVREQQVDRALYLYRQSAEVRQHAVGALALHPALQPKIGTYTYNSGEQAHMLQLDGTVAITFQGARYNIPVTIWLPEWYPHHPPFAYVSPTQNMLVKPNHRHVDGQGRLYHPYLAGWKPQTSTLTGLIAQLCEAFSEDPPVRAVGAAGAAKGRDAHLQQPQQQQQPPQQQPPPPVSVNPYATGASAGGYGSSVGGPAAAAAVGPMGGGRSAEQSEHARLVAQITALCQDRVSLLNHEITKEMDGLFSQQNRLAREAEELSSQITRIRTDEQQLEQAIANVQARDTEITQWLAEHEADANDDIDIDEVLKPKNAISKQLVDLTAEVYAIEDCIYYMGKAMQNGQVDLETFLKSIRKLAREQFMARALLIKVATRQRELLAGR